VLIDGNKIEKEILELLDLGFTLDESLTKLHFEKKIGLILLWKPIVKIKSFTKKESKRYLVGVMNKKLIHEETGHMNRRKSEKSEPCTIENISNYQPLDGLPDNNPPYKDHK
jgi:hypothetical protein